MRAGLARFWRPPHNPPVPRALVYIIAFILASFVLRHVPVIGGLFRGLLGFYLLLVLFAAAAAIVGRVLVRRRRLAEQVRVLSLVETPHNQAKLGTLLLGEGRPRAALAPLEYAHSKEPRNPEWGVALGDVYRALGRHREALERYDAVLAFAPEHGFGGLLARRAAALESIGDVDGALETLRSLEAAHGAAPESAARIGMLLRRTNHKDEAREHFRRAIQLAQSAPIYVRRKQRRWILRARWHSLVG